MRRHGTLLTAAAAALLAVGGCASDSVLDLRVGDCFSSADLGSNQVSSVEPLDCAVEHDAEIYGEHVFTGQDYPGADTVRDASDAVCREKFAAFVGVSAEESNLHYSTLYPTQESWDDARDRTTLCVLLTDEPVTGSLEDAGV